MPHSNDEQFNGRMSALVAVSLCHQVEFEAQFFRPARTLLQ